MKKRFLLALFVIAPIAGYFYTSTLIEKGQKPVADGTHDYLIILGAKVKPNGVASLSLQYRLDAAIDYLHTHEHVKVIVSGGQGADEEQSEASFMYNVLIQNNIAASRILIEDRSTSTYENLLYTKQLLPQGTHHLTIVSSDYHLYRAQYIAKKLQLSTDVVVAKTPASVRERLILRERLAIVKTLIVGR